MTIQQLIFILLASFAAVMFIALLILVFIYGRATVKDKPNEAAIFVKNGKHVDKPFKAKLIESGRNGLCFMYKKHTVMIPKSYADIFYRNRRMIFINHIGQLIAQPFDKQDIPITKSAQDNLIYEMVSSHIGADGMRALKGKPTQSIIIVAILAFAIGAVAVFGFNYFKDNYKPASKPPVTQQQIQIPSGEVVEVE